MSLGRAPNRFAAARVLTGAMVLVGMAPGVLGQDTRPWVDPPAQQAPAPPQAAAPQITSPAPEPATSPPVKQAAPMQPAAAPAAPPPALKVARPATSPSQALRAEPQAARTLAPRTRLTTSPRPMSKPQTVRRAEPPRKEPTRVVAQPRPSFNCSAAQTAVEQAICADPMLAAKDMRMALLYEQAGGSRYRPVDERQWRWLAAREACGRVPRAVLEACIARTYDARIAELSGAR